MVNLEQFKVILDWHKWEDEIERDKMTAALREARKDLLIPLAEETGVGDV